MKTFYAVGDKRCPIPVLTHPYHSRTGANCSFFPPCPITHMDAIPKNLGPDNYNTCESFTLFESLDDAKKFVITDKFKYRADGSELYLIFKVQVDKHVLPAIVQENETVIFRGVNRLKITSLDESIIVQEALFANTLPDFTRGGDCSIF